MQTNYPQPTQSTNETNTKIPFPAQEYIKYLKNSPVDRPSLQGNQYLQDTALHSYLQKIIPKEVLQIAEHQNHGLIDLGDKVATCIKEIGDQAENNPPKFVKAEIPSENQIVLSEAWKQQRTYAAIYNIVGSAYNNIPEIQEYQRLIQQIKIYLYHPSSGMFTGTLAMVDGCAYMIKTMLENNFIQDQKVRLKLQNTYNRLTSSDPEQFWTCGNWMTEKKGGSDIQRSIETVAIQYKPNKYKLYGYKNFCSASDCNVALVLARIVPNQNINSKQIAKSPISLFLIKLRKKDNSSNNIEFHNLLEKIGTRPLPTMEVVLNGSKATLISPPGQGIKCISIMLQVTRMYNCASAVGNMKRMITLCRDFQKKRMVFGQKLQDHPMQLKLMSDMEVIHRANLLFFLKASHLFNKEQLKIATEGEKNISRLFSPLLKLFTSREVKTISIEAMEILGGQSYCENTNIPYLFRDSHVLSIWEGSTNVLCLDFYRALRMKSNPICYLYKFISKILIDDLYPNSYIVDSNRVEEALNKCIIAFNQLMRTITVIIKDYKLLKSKYEYYLRDIAMGLSRLICAVLLLEHYLQTMEKTDLEVFLRWVNIQPIYNTDQSIDVKLQKELSTDKQICSQYQQQNIIPKL